MIEIRKNDDGLLDEITSNSCEIHLEKYDVDHWWLGIYGSNGQKVHVEFLQCKEVLISSQSDAEQRNEAVAVGQLCPLCRGTGSYHNANHWQTCINCKGTGQI